MVANINKIVESLNPNERKVLPFLNKKIGEICKATGLDKTSVLRALQFLSNKNIVQLKLGKEDYVELGVNGILYRKKHLPERRLLHLLSETPNISLQDAKQKSGLSDNEFKAALGALKNKAMLELKSGRLILSAKKEEISKKTLEEQFLESLPLKKSELKPEQQLAFKSLFQRKNIITILSKQTVEYNLTDLGKQLLEAGIKEEKNTIETLTSKDIQEGTWKGKKFRRYDIKSYVPRISGGKRHFVNQAVDYARKIWTELGFKEMSGNLIQSSFWNFDALFTPQDHPARELQDTFFIKEKESKLPDKQIVQQVKKTHEQGIAESKGWQYSWQEAEAKKTVLRTHTTCLSAQTLAELGKLKETKDKVGKFFAIGKCFRNETIDAGHLFEFNQTEGIIIDKNANFQHLLGYLKEFLNKMGFEKIRFRPHYFPYTEPSVEADVYNEKTGKWVEILGAGIFRPEVVVPLLGEYIPVLAWGMGFDRLIMENFEIKDIRELYQNNITQLREIKFW